MSIESGYHPLSCTPEPTVYSLGIFAEACLGRLFTASGIEQNSGNLEQFVAKLHVFIEYSRISPFPLYDHQQLRPNTNLSHHSRHAVIV